MDPSRVSSVGRGLMRALADALPSCTVACYVVGSRGEGVATTSSDLDIVVLLDNASPEASAARVARDWATNFWPLRLDVIVSTAESIGQRHPALIRTCCSMPSP